MLCVSSSVSLRKSSCARKVRKTWKLGASDKKGWAGWDRNGGWSCVLAKSLNVQKTRGGKKKLPLLKQWQIFIPFQRVQWYVLYYLNKFSIFQKFLASFCRVFFSICCHSCGENLVEWVLCRYKHFCHSCYSSIFCCICQLFLASEKVTSGKKSSNKVCFYHISRRTQLWMNFGEPNW